MPYGYMTPEIYLTHHGVTAYHSYKDDDADSRLEYHFTTAADEDPEYEFDVRDLSTWVAPTAPAVLSQTDSPAIRQEKQAAWARYHSQEQAAICQAIEKAIDQGELRLPRPPLDTSAATPDAGTSTDPGAFLAIIEVQTTGAYVRECGGPQAAASAMAGAFSGLLNRPTEAPEQHWDIVDATVYPLR